MANSDVDVAPPLPNRIRAWGAAPGRVLLIVLGTALLLTVVALASNAEPLPATGPDGSDIVPLAVQRGELSEGEDQRSNETVVRTPDFEPIRIPRPLLIAGAVLAGAAVLYFLALQRIAIQFRRSKVAVATSNPTLTAEEEATEIVRITRDLIDELAEGDDPRLAIQRAYAAVETGFGTDELARKPAETPLKYLTRVFGRNENAAAPLEKLTELFQVARFSDQPVDEQMRNDAIAHLSEIRERYKDRLSAQALKFNTRAL